ncbi:MULTISPECIES: MerR family transcriptional regulator [Brevibacterium]|uniref:DNA-binding transcriptional regulator, MerR family n=1 Tax=Brevibacterium antiquum CNRZ 918 TaxID=1255637 RepID=A0A2H1ICD8_9MICO|nr:MULTISPECIES: MerR family transcriptional regulator [Brevibacterium]SMX72881.1 DNA-binding transcriptional regulator, MerR family [Brevibacterium antiquum CNRZ 918]HCG56880.1 MerR family DNA-binding transcriptional regulator [Brevibacterium sp.]
MAHQPASPATPVTTPAPPLPIRDPRIRRALSTEYGSELSISEVCEHLGITAHTARYYERAGLIEVPRSQSGHRTYDQSTVERLDFLVRMRTSGMGISELRRYVDLVRAGEATTEQRLQIMLDQRERIVSQLHELELALVTTDYKIVKYGGAPNDNRTPENTSPSSHHTEGDPS